MPKGSTVPALRSVADDATVEVPPPHWLSEKSGLFDARDTIAAVGLVLVVVGVALIYPPAAWIVLGAALLVVAWLT